MNNYGLLGKSLSHSFSPQIHRYLGNYEYNIYEKSENELEEFIKKADYKGLNVTIPYKKTVMKYCNSLSECAQKIGSVNTIVKKADGTIIGDNTDYYGFEFMVKKALDSNYSIKGSRVLVLGNGGAAVTVRQVMLDMEASDVIIVSRKKCVEEHIVTYEDLKDYYDSDYIVNTTPVGMYPDNGYSPIDISYFKNCKIVFDIIYNPSSTKLVLSARDNGIKAVSGLTMLVAQAKRASEIFRNIDIRDSVIEDVVNKVNNETMNITLIGMPGCGKSTAGRELAKRIGRVFIDIDEEIIREEKKSIPEIFEQNGEEYFRRLETKVLSKWTKQSNLVIATGGGIVTRPQNRHLIQQHSKIIFLDRDIELLETDGRPVSRAKPLTQIYHERIDNYNLWSDVIIKSNTLNQVVEDIQRFFS